MENVRENLHHIIDAIDDDTLLEAVYEILRTTKSQAKGSVWNSLSDDQKKQVIKSSEGIHDPDKQTSHEEIMQQNKKWLDK